MAFLNKIFPLKFAELTEEPMFNTTIVGGKNRQEVRNANWQDPLHTYNAAFGVNNYADIQTLKTFFYLAKGKESSFLVEVDLDNSVETFTEVREAVLGIGNEQAFQIHKEYTEDGDTYDRDIIKVYDADYPTEAENVILRHNGVERSYVKWQGSRGATTVDPYNEYTVDPDLGLIYFDALTGGATVDFTVARFFVPVRFDTDKLPITMLTKWLTAGGIKSNVKIPDIPLVEVRDAS